MNRFRKFDDEIEKRTRATYLEARQKNIPHDIILQACVRNFLENAQKYKLGLIQTMQLQHKIVTICESLGR